MTKQRKKKGDYFLEKPMAALLSPIRQRPSKNFGKPSYKKEAFESDYYRIVTSAPLRRLQDKTQIFPLEERDFARRRLTHSMEVACIARLMARKIEVKLIQKGVLRSNCDFVKYRYISSIVEAAGLMHDIGNPPYGHFGEDTIKTYFKKLAELGIQRKNEKSVTGNIKQIIADAFIQMESGKQNDFFKFDGNVQGFRALCRLGLSADDSAFNLTYPTLASIIKYPHSSVFINNLKDEQEKEYWDQRHDTEKIGYFCSETDRYKKICSALHLRPNYRHPLTYIVEAADDIVNVTSDVEDGFKMGVISIDEIYELAKNDINGDRKYKNSLLKGTIETYIENQSKKCNDSTFNGRRLTLDLWVKEFRIRCTQLLIDEAVSVFVQHFDNIVKEAYDNGYNTPDMEDKILGNELLCESDLTIVR